MCVIAFCKKRQLSLEEWDNCASSNGDGIGIGWRYKGNVKYIKGIMDTKKAWEMYQKLNIKTAHIVHFRIQTTGGTCQELTHPFLVTTKSPLKLRYSGKSPLLFHNGVIRDWEEWSMPYYIANKFIPKGKMSDSRLAAMIISSLGKEALNKLSGKYILFTPKETVAKGDFTEEKGVFFSNGSFKYSRTVTYSPHTTTLRKPIDYNVRSSKTAEQADNEWWRDNYGYVY